VQLAHKTVKKIIEKMGWKMLQHLPHCPDLALSNFHLFGPQSESLGNIKFKNVEDTTAFCPDISTGANKYFNATGFG